MIWSELLNVTKLSGGKFPNVEHFDSKSAVGDYMRKIELPTTFFLPGFFMPNFEQWIQKAPPNNDWSLFLPMDADTPIPMFSPGDDSGTFVKAILTHRDTLLGKNVYAATDYYTPTQIMDVFAEAYPKTEGKVKYVQISKEDYKGSLGGMGMPEKAQQELYENMMFMKEFGYYGKASLDESLAVSIMPFLLSVYLSVWDHTCDQGTPLLIAHIDSRREANHHEGFLRQIESMAGAQVEYR